MTLTFNEDVDVEWVNPAGDTRPPYVRINNSTGDTIAKRHTPLKEFENDDCQMWFDYVTVDKVGSKHKRVIYRNSDSDSDDDADTEESDGGESESEHDDIEEVEEKFACAVCKAKFPSSDARDDHIRGEHPDL